MKSVDGNITLLIENHFVELSDCKIITAWHIEKDNFAYITGNGLIGFKIYIKKKDYKKLNVYQRLGLLAHELAHISLDMDRGPFRQVLADITGIFSSKKLSDLERRADKLAIEKGCGEYVLKFIKYHDNRYKKYNDKDGLMKREIQNMIKEMNGSRISSKKNVQI